MNGSWELTTTGCTLNFTCAVRHMYTHTHSHNINKCETFKTLTSVFSTLPWKFFSPMHVCYFSLLLCNKCSSSRATEVRVNRLHRHICILRPCRDEQSHLCKRLPALMHLNNRQHRRCWSGSLYELTVQREPKCHLEGLPVLLWDQTLVSIGVSLHLIGSVYFWLKRFIISNTKRQEEKSVSSVGSEDCSLALGFRKPNELALCLRCGDRENEKIKLSFVVDSNFRRRRQCWELCPGLCTFQKNTLLLTYTHNSYSNI